MMFIWYSPASPWFLWYILLYKALKLVTSSPWFLMRDGKRSSGGRTIFPDWGVGRRLLVFLQVCLISLLKLSSSFRTETNPLAFYRIHTQSRDKGNYMYMHKLHVHSIFCTCICIIRITCTTHSFLLWIIACKCIFPSSSLSPLLLTYYVI